MWDGREMTRRLKHDLLESDNSAFISTYLSYRYINEAANNYVMRTNSVRKTQTITTVKDQVGYTLASDFLSIYTQESGDRFIKYNNGATNFFPEFENYEEIIHKSSSSSTAIPSQFSVIDDPTQISNITGTTTSAGAASNGESTLTDTTADFSSVSEGDMVHNETDVDSNGNGSYGLVIEVTSATALLVAMFDGTDADWTSGDSYIIVPQGRIQLILDPPPTTAGDVITVYYNARPTPVFSPFRTFRIQSQFIPEILRDAKGLYEFRGGDYQKGGVDKQMAQVGTLNANLNYSKAFQRKGYGVNVNARRRR
jgi:hypothetical protein